MRDIWLACLKRMHACMHAGNVSQAYHAQRDKQRRGVEHDGIDTCAGRAFQCMGILGFRSDPHCTADFEVVGFMLLHAQKQLLWYSVPGKSIRVPHQ